jgi:hypothetical protein
MRRRKSRSDAARRGLLGREIGRAGLGGADRAGKKEDQETGAEGTKENHGRNRQPPDVALVKACSLKVV